MNSRFLSGLIVVAKHTALTVFLLIVLFPVLEVWVTLLMTLAGVNFQLNLCLQGIPPFGSPLCAYFPDSGSEVVYALRIAHYSGYFLGLVFLGWANLTLHQKRLRG